MLFLRIFHGRHSEPIILGGFCLNVCSLTSKWQFLWGNLHYPVNLGVICFQTDKLEFLHSLGQLLNLHLLYIWCSNETHGICRLPFRKSQGIYGVCSGNTQQRSKNLCQNQLNMHMRSSVSLGNLIRLCIPNPNGPTVGVIHTSFSGNGVYAKTANFIGNMVTSIIRILGYSISRQTRSSN